MCWLLRQNEASCFSGHFVMACIHHAGRTLQRESDALETSLQSLSSDRSTSIDFDLRLRSEHVGLADEL